MGRIFGIPIELNYSWVLVYLLLTFLLAQQFEESRLGWTAAHRWSVAMVIVVLFFLSVLVHELSHSLVAMRRGIPVQGITLFIFGGVSRLGREPEGPLTEFSIAVVGPLTSVILAAIFGGIWYALGDGSSTLQVSLFLLAWTNLALAGFNILPGYPLDGGRVLRAAVWAATGNLQRATRIAARAGQGVGALTVVGGVFLALLVNPIDGIWIGIVGAFLFSVATASYRREPMLE